MHMMNGTPGHLGGAWCAEQHAGPHSSPDNLCKQACTGLVSHMIVPLNLRASQCGFCLDHAWQSHMDALPALFYLISFDFISFHSILFWHSWAFVRQHRHQSKASTLHASGPRRYVPACHSAQQLHQGEIWAKQQKDCPLGSATIDGTWNCHFSQQPTISVMCSVSCYVES